MPVLTEAVTPTEPVIVMTKMFDAPRERVWKTLTTPEHVRQWYGGRHFSGEVLEMDVRRGGRWTHLMRTPDGFEFKLEFIYMDVVPPQRLVWQDTRYGSRPQGGPPPSRISVTLTDEGERTGWRMEARFPSLEDREEALRMGFSSTMEQGVERFEQVLQSLEGSR